MGEWESGGENGDVSLCSQSPVAILLSIVRNSNRRDLCLWEVEILVIRSDVVCFGIGVSRGLEKNDDLPVAPRITLAA